MKFLQYAKQSGPGWVQAAVTLGGGSLVGALYLGVIGGYEFLWLQPLAMLCGIIMLSAISYVTLSNEERPFRLVQKKVSPALAWGWLIATVIADTVFCAAQFSLGSGALTGNLGVDINPYVITGSFFIICLSLLAISQKEGKASKIIDNVLKVLVAIIVLSFMGVVATLALKGAINWGHLFGGLIPDFSALFKPTDQINTAIQATGDQAEYWTNYVTGEQRSKIITAFGTAVGINMTFLLPYSLRKKGWGKEQRELSRFDLVFGLFIPFMLGASALVISSAASFHAKHADVISAEGKPLEGMEGIYYEVLDKRIASSDDTYADDVKEMKSLSKDIALWEKEGGPAEEILNAQAQLTLLSEAVATKRDEVPLQEKQLAAMLSNRKASNLAKSLEPFLGSSAQLIFGVGVLAMAISTMLVHMMMNGYAISEAFNKLGNAKVFMLGAAMPATAGLFSPILWDGPSKAAMQVPAAVIATTLLPIAYLAFLLLMNSKSALGEELPKKRGLINILMILSAGIASFASVWALSSKGTEGMIGIVALGVLALVGIFGFVKNNKVA
ncbi:Natural resistance-associated macrophage protein [Rubritalea squalenifaciens DSM 18772]|uniref:Natural resistance-associated macrophage protein n=1 Tax=Rubritalea squalenifaciens DSM 18772 TaxID=1123071 RepID=A0A1M6BAV1_9BACT|nr:divalent metal cation transporter [Rubritalea squalenifaciens]SHI45842.1 Natural resistance-associated macrophage protein [Rubritalea squalenifaciens DSM 18772]